jgi:hypothetical protein
LLFPYTDLIDIVNKHPQVNAVPMDTSEFKNWEDKFIKGMKDDVLKNHVLFVAKDSNSIMVQECAGAPVIRHLLVRQEYQHADWRPLFQLQQLTPPGLPDIKWNELYAKWGKFVPEEKKSSLKYYVEKPPESLKKAIAEQSAAAKAARSKRTRSGGGNNVADNGGSALQIVEAKKNVAVQARKRINSGNAKYVHAPLLYCGCYSYFY